MSSTTPSIRATAIADLTHLVVSWPELRDALTARAANWPPAGRMADYQRQLTADEEAAERYVSAAERAERTALAPGEHPAPLRVSVLDTIAAVEDELLALADEIAGSIQRPAYTVRSASPDDRIALDMALMAARDAADRRRWRFNLAAERDGATAAAWLADRLTSSSGPFRPLADDQVRRIAATAAACRRRAEPLLASPTATNGRPVDLDQACGCGGKLTLTNELADFRIRCNSCGTSWSGNSLLADLNVA